jgi:hypothetical protein
VVLNPGGALLIALVSRLLMSMTDLLFAGGAVLAERRYRRTLAGSSEVARP